MHTLYLQTYRAQDTWLPNLELIPLAHKREYKYTNAHKHNSKRKAGSSHLVT